MVRPFTRVLVGTDFSDHAARAVERAVDVARRYGASLQVVHVWELPLVLDGAAAGAELDWISLVEHAAREQLDAAVATLGDCGVAVTSALRCGAAWDRITDLAAETDADLVVVGTQGRTGLGRALLGSVAERVVRFSPAPVLTIH